MITADPNKQAGKGTGFPASSLETKSDISSRAAKGILNGPAPGIVDQVAGSLLTSV